MGGGSGIGEGGPMKANPRGQVEVGRRLTPPPAETAYFCGLGWCCWKAIWPWHQCKKATATMHHSVREIMAYLLEERAALEKDTFVREHGEPPYDKVPFSSWAITSNEMECDLIDRVIAYIDGKEE